MDPDSPAMNHRTPLAVLICLAQFLDTFNNAAFFAVIPSIAFSLNIPTNSAVWLVCAHQITFASFMLLSGRLCSVYNPKTQFIFGLSAIGVLSIASGLMRNVPALLCLRALFGIATAFAVPSARHLITHLTPDQDFHRKALLGFGWSGALGNVLGLMLGAVFSQYVHWSWLFFAEAILALPVAVVVHALVPRRRFTSDDSTTEKTIVPVDADVQKIDWFGVSLVASSLVLFVLAITSVQSKGGSSPLVIAPLVIAAVLVGSLVFWETRIAPGDALFPPKLWRTPNVPILLTAGFVPMLWQTVSLFAFTTIWQDLYWSPTACALHLLPLALITSATFVVSFTSLLSSRFSSKVIVVGGLVLVCVANILLPFAERAEYYWPFAFPGFVVGAIGSSLAWTHANDAILRAAPRAYAGTVDALFKATIQLGSALGVACATTLQVHVDARGAGDWDFNGRRAALWLVLGVSFSVACATAFFYRPQLAPPEDAAGTGTGTGLGLGVGAESDSSVNVKDEKESGREREVELVSPEVVVARLMSDR